VIKHKLLHGCLNRQCYESWPSYVCLSVFNKLLLTLAVSAEQCRAKWTAIYRAGMGPTFLLVNKTKTFHAASNGHTVNSSSITPFKIFNFWQLCCTIAATTTYQSFFLLSIFRPSMQLVWQHKKISVKNFPSIICKVYFWATRSMLRNSKISCVTKI